MITGIVLTALKFGLILAPFILDAITKHQVAKEQPKEIERNNNEIIDKAIATHDSDVIALLIRNGIGK